MRGKYPNFSEAGLFKGADMDRKTDFQKSDETVSLILKAAVQVFSENGYRASTMQMIAEKAGLVPSGIYYYYSGKRELLEAVVDYLLSYLENSVFERWRQVVKAEGMEGFIEDAVKVVEEEKTYIRLLGSLIAGAKDLDDSYRRRLAGFFLKVKEDIRNKMPNEETADEAEALAEDMYAYVFLYVITGSQKAFDRQMRQSRERYRKITEKIRP